MPKIKVYDDGKAKIWVEAGSTPFSTTGNLGAYGCHAVALNDMSYLPSLPSIGLNAKLTPTNVTHEGFASLEAMLAVYNTHVRAVSLAMPQVPEPAAWQEHVDQKVKDWYDRAARLGGLVTMYTLACVVNYEKSSRSNAQGVKTWRFIQALVRLKLGHLVASPVVANRTNSAGWGGVSFVQGFVWIPQQNRAMVENTAFISNLAKLEEFSPEKVLKELLCRNASLAPAKTPTTDDLFHNYKNML